MFKKLEKNKFIDTNYYTSTRVKFGVNNNDNASVNGAETNNNNNNNNKKINHFSNHSKKMLKCEVE